MRERTVSPPDRLAIRPKSALPDQSVDPVDPLVGRTQSDSRAPLQPPLFLVPVLPVETLLPDKVLPLFQMLHHFDTVTCATMGSTFAQHVFKSSAFSIAIQTPYLLHALLGVSAAHLYHLLPAAQHPVQHRQSKLADAYHWSTALSLLRQEFSRRLHQQNMDGVLSAVMLLAVHQFMLPDPDPSKSFIYAPEASREGAMTWLTIHMGFNLLDAELKPYIPDSIWYPVMQDAILWSRSALSPLDEPNDETERLFMELCDITPQSSPKNNPYYSPLEYLFCVRRVHPSMHTFHKLVTFMGALEPPYRSLLSARDKPALLILAHWLAIMTGVQQWWITGRSRAECIAIITFLMLDKDDRVRALLEWPAEIAGVNLHHQGPL